MRRALSFLAALLLAAGALSGVFWLTRPEPSGERPGPRKGVAEALSRIFVPPGRLPPVDPESPAGEIPAGAVGPIDPKVPVPRGFRVEWVATGEPDRPIRIRLEPGARLHTEPEAGAGVVTVLRVQADLRVLDRRPGWVQVRYGDRTGWATTAGNAADSDVTEPPFGSEPEPVRPVASRPPDPARLAQARAWFGGRETLGQLGPYALYTDLQDPESLRALDRVAAEFERVYTARYGRDPVGGPTEAVVLYGREADYRGFQDQDEQLAALPSSGHTGFGIIALFDDDRPGEEMAATLVHELAHLLNRRALGPVLPSWLDEGIADDLAQSAIDESGRLRPGTVGGTTVRAGNTLQTYGGRAALIQLYETLVAGRLRPLTELLGLDWDDFVRRDGNLNYAHASFWVRYLIDGEGGALAPGFRTFLNAVASGTPPTAEALQDRLDRPWSELQDGFEAWVLEQREGLTAVTP